MDKNQLQYKIDLEGGNGAIRNSGEISELWFYFKKRGTSHLFVSENSAHTANKRVFASFSSSRSEGKGKVPTLVQRPRWFLPHLQNKKQMAFAWGYAST